MRLIANGTMLSVFALWACSGSPSTPGASISATESGGDTGAGATPAGSSAGDGQHSAGGTQRGTGGTQDTTSTGGTQGATGGVQSSSGGVQTASGGSQSATGGTSGAGGTLATGGTPATGGTLAAGGTSTGGTPSTTGGTPSTGGTPNTTGGTASTGGTPSAAGGTSGTGGTLVSTGGVQGNTGGTQGTTTPALQSSESDPTYAISGPWHGYIWPAVDTNHVATISPSESEAYRGQPGPPFCATGHVPATSNSTAVAMIGMNTAQERSGGATATQWTPTGEGILVNVSNPGGSPLRLQIQTNETGAIGEEWCAMITQFDQNVLVRWGDFYQHAQCANKVGDPYSGDMAGIATVMVLVPGTSEGDGYDFDFCVNEMTPV